MVKAVWETQQAASSSREPESRQQAAGIRSQSQQSEECSKWAIPPELAAKEQVITRDQIPGAALTSQIPENSQDNITALKEPPQLAHNAWVPIEHKLSLVKLIRRQTGESSGQETEEPRSAL